MQGSAPDQLWPRPARRFDPEHEDGGEPMSFGKFVTPPSVTVRAQVTVLTIKLTSPTRDSRSSSVADACTGLLSHVPADLAAALAHES